MDILSIVDPIMRASGVQHWGVVCFGRLSHILEVSAKRRLPENPRSVLVALFPYYSGDFEHANLSKYCMARDYHIAVGNMLADAVRSLQSAFPDHAFVAFCDSSPVPEVEAACRAGLGVRGENGLLISPDYGSYVFIGEIITDLTLPANEVPLAVCRECGACRAACPTGALGDTFAKSRCLSALTQKKRELSASEADAVRQGGLVWGCDRCQDVCPMNANVKRTEITEFQTSLKGRLSLEEVTSENFAKENSDRAYLWRGAGVLARNICIIESTPEDNK